MRTLLTATLLTGAITLAGASSAHALPTADLALGKPVTASAEHSAYPATNTVDGNSATSWLSFGDANQWLKVDLGQQSSLSQVRLGWKNSFGHWYEVLGSSDGVTWTQLYSTTSGDGGEDLIPVAGSARYVQLKITRGSSARLPFDLADFEVYGG